MCSREEDERLGEGEGGACGSREKRTNKHSETAADCLDGKKPNKIVWSCGELYWSKY
jgi:hypothetical protein